MAGRGLHCPATAEGVAAALPAADPRLVRDVLALCGGDLAVTLATLATAIGTVVAERVTAEARLVVVSGVGRAIGGAVALHNGPWAGRG